ncbi:MAG: isochorismatase family protein [Armatimonadota bacterium]|nr:isochorismatase family protein [Armatimonadota bacterium]
MNPCLPLIATLVLIAALSANAATPAQPKDFDPAFFKNCAFVCVDLQEVPRVYMKAEQMPDGWKQQGFTVEDCNKATDYLFDVAMPNAVKVADACRARKLPMIFIHWGYLCEDGMDLDPATRRTFLHDIGPDPKKWPHHISDPTSRPAECLKVRKGEYVVAKSAQDAFISSRIDFILNNLGVKNIIFVGGHTQGCLFGTASSAKRLGYNTLCVEDATWNARESTRKKGIQDVGFTYVKTAEELVALLSASEGK